MLHSFQLNGYNIVMDVNSGAVHVVDGMVYDMIQLLDADFLARSFDSSFTEKLEQAYPAQLFCTTGSALCTQPTGGRVRRDLRDVPERSAVHLRRL